MRHSSRDFIRAESAKARRRAPKWRWFGVALAWATAIYSALLVAVLVWPAHGWSHADQLGLAQLATAVAGFGAGLFILYAASQQYAASFGAPQLVIHTEPQPSSFLMEADFEQIGATIGIELANIGSAIAAMWQFEIVCPPPLSIDVPRDWKELSDGRFVCYRNTPIFAGGMAPVGTITVIIQRPDQLATSRTVQHFLPVTVTTESATIDTAIAFSVTYEAPAMEHEGGPQERDALEDAGIGKSIYDRDF